MTSPITDNPPTPTPWKYGHFGTNALWIGPDYDQTHVALVDHDTFDARENSRANAAFICRAVNSFEELVGALEHARNFIASEYTDERASALEGHPIHKDAREIWDVLSNVLAKVQTP